MYLVDTNAVSELVRPRPNAALSAWFKHQTELALSVVTVEELAFGVARSVAPKRSTLLRWFEALLSTSLLLDVTPAVARAAGELRAGRENAGRPVAQADMLIAATALVHGLPLATRNLRDFDDCGIAVLDPFVP